MYGNFAIPSPLTNHLQEAQTLRRDAESHTRTLVNAREKWSARHPLRDVIDHCQKTDAALASLHAAVEAMAKNQEGSQMDRLA